MAASSSEPDALSLLLAGLVAEFPIVSKAEPLLTGKPRAGVIAHLNCGHNHDTKANSEQVQIAPGKKRYTQSDCVPALKELLEEKHAACIAEAEAERDAERTLKIMRDAVDIINASVTGGAVEPVSVTEPTTTIEEALDF